MAYQVWIIDGLTQLAELTAFEKIQAVEVDLAHGNWVVVLNQDHVNAGAIAEKILNAVFLGIEILDTDTGWRYAGPCNYLDRVYSAPGRIKQIEMRGTDHMDWLDALLEWPDELDVTRWWVTAQGSLALSTTVTNSLNFQGGPFGDFARKIPNLHIIDPPTAFGPVKTQIATGLPLAEVWEPWFTGTDWTYRLQLHRAEAVNELRFTLGERAVSPMIVTPGIQGEIRITEVAAQATFVAAMGDKVTGSLDPNERWAYGAQGDQLDWRTRRREKHVNLPASDYDTLRTAAEAELATLGPKRTVVVPDFELPEYGDTTQLGDLVRVHYDDDADELLVPIGSSTLTGTEKGWKRTVSIGREVPVGPRQLAANYTAIAKHLRRLEGNLR